ncbi:hypothetical protein NKH89_23665 [Mesorhizobium sp. M0923]|uniref:hypothetical protein n=1 Tax=Mesorhizobium sp. M0923 TaxID=2957028 RepID=UPI0033371B53
MVETRQIITSLVITNAGTNVTEIDAFGRHMTKAAKSASDGFKVIDTASSQSAAKVKANFDRIVVALPGRCN